MSPDHFNALCFSVSGRCALPSACQPTRVRRSIIERQQPAVGERFCDADCGDGDEVDNARRRSRREREGGGPHVPSRESAHAAPRCPALLSCSKTTDPAVGGRRYD